MKADQKSLTQIIGDTIKYTLVCYPVYSALYAAISPDTTFVEKLKDPSTVVAVGGIGLAYFLCCAITGYNPLRRQ